MKKSDIHFSVELDKENIPDRILWEATDAPESDGGQDTKAISLNLWDPQEKNTLRIDLWTKDMPVDEMKRFYLDCLGGISQSLLNATGDEYMSTELNALCDKFVKHLENEFKSNQN